jgi:hypothetical protein
MEKSKINRGIVAVFMESPLYFTIPIRGILNRPSWIMLTINISVSPPLRKGDLS